MVRSNNGAECDRVVFWGSTTSVSVEEGASAAGNSVVPAA